ncbi:uncharacterized protein LOC127702665 [Mytilus californianus]|uniref:uncharacterized protein LOC127702665 n=1 Tax=Mytilus californianus TaxID=6549 RepID=UPI0022464D66|nr:uncharacterized protein LOC127702665 [Mytilus californianus]
MPVTRNKARKNYKLISEFGFGHEDVLDVSDPTSDIFDHETTPDDEVDRLEHRIHNLEVSISEKERKLEKADFEKQGAIPKTRLKSKYVESSNLNDLVKEKGVGDNSSRPRQLQSSAPKVKSTETAGKKTKPAKRKDSRDSKSFKKKDSRSTLVCDFIAKHVKTIRRCHLQAFPGANIWDIINLLNCGTIQVNYDIILVHVGTNNVGTYEVADFDIAYNVLISTIEKLVKPHTVIVMSAIIPRLLDFQNTCYFVTTINSRLRSLCFKRGVQFVATYKPFLKFGMPVCELYSPICRLHLNYFGNLKLTNFFVQVLAHC